MANPPAPGESRGKTALQVLILAAAVLWIYWPALHGSWLWDDDIYVINNPDVRSAVGLGRIWLGKAGINYFPISETVQWLQWHLWADQTFGYHLTNAALHLLSALLVWRLVRKLGIRHGWLAGLVFAIHPVAVESVAWISELKNTLSLPPLLMAAYAWVEFDARDRGEVRGRNAWYARALGWFVVAMLCKSTIVMFPVMILLYAWWRRGRVKGGDLAASLPFFGVSLALGLVTSWLERYRGGRGTPLPPHALGVHFAAAGTAAMFYLSKALVPVRTYIDYPMWIFPGAAWIPALPWLAVAGLLSWCAAAGRISARAVLFALGWFWGMSLLMLGLFPMRYQAISWVADHFNYVSLVAVGAAVAAAFGSWERRAGKRLAAGSAAIGAAVAVFVSRAYAARFGDAASLWSHVAAANPESWAAHDSLGAALSHAGQPLEAEAEFEKELRLRPSPEGEYRLATDLVQAGRLRQAIPHYFEAIWEYSDYVEALDGLGRDLAELGRYEEAGTVFELSLKITPDDIDIQNQRALARKDARRAAAAGAGQDPFEREYSLGSMLARLRRFDDAAEHLRAAIRIQPESAAAHLNYGNLLYMQQKLPEAAEQFRAAVRINPRDPGAKKNLELVEAALSQGSGTK